MEAKNIAMRIRKRVELPDDRSIRSTLDFMDKVAELSFKAGVQFERDRIKAKLAHPPICFSKEVLESEQLVLIMVQVRKYYQAVFDDAMEVDK